MYHRVVTLKLADVSEVRTTSIIRAMNQLQRDYTALHPKRLYTEYNSFSEITSVPKDHLMLTSKEQLKKKAQFESRSIGTVIVELVLISVSVLSGIRIITSGLHRRRY
jgi:hypothetical protein